MDIKIAWDYDATLLAGPNPEVDGFEIWTWDAVSNTRVELLGQTTAIPTDAAPFTFRVSMKKTIQGTFSFSVWATATDSQGVKFYSAVPASMSVAVRPPDVTGLRQV